MHRIISEAVSFLSIERDLQDKIVTGANLALKNRTPDDTNLRKFLEMFSDSCSRRTSLSVQSWVELFHSLCLFSIYKTILIDAYALRAQYESPRRWKHSDAVSIDCVYRTLVSIFTWASGVKDPMLSEDYDSEDANTHEMLKSTREMIKIDRWKERGIKSSKDFLMNLGRGIFDDRTFNGFVLQTYRLDKRLGQSQKARKGSDRMSLDGLGGDGYLTGSSRPQTGSQSPFTNTSKSVSQSLDTISPNRDINSIPTLNPTHTQPIHPTTKTTAVKQWLDSLSIPNIPSNTSNDLYSSSQVSGNATASRTTNQYLFGYPLQTQSSNTNTQSSSTNVPLGGMHTASWLENNLDVGQATQATSRAEAMFSLIFDGRQ